MYRIKTYNQIADIGLSRFPRDRYEVGPDGATARMPSSCAATSCTANPCRTACWQWPGPAPGSTTSRSMNTRTRASWCSIRRAPTPTPSRSWSPRPCCWVRGGILDGMNRVQQLTRHRRCRADGQATGKGKEAVCRQRDRRQDAGRGRPGRHRVHGGQRRARTRHASGRLRSGVVGRGGLAPVEPGPEGRQPGRPAARLGFRHACTCRRSSRPIT